MVDRNSIISTHLPYEIDMLRYAYQRLLDFVPQEEGNAFIECFCVHARNLLDFFWDETPKRKNYAVARHFTSPSYKPFEDLSPKKKNGLYGKLHDQIVHLTYGRTDDSSARIGHDARVSLRELIEREIDNFSSHIETPYRDLWRHRGEKFCTLRAQNTPTSNTGSVRFVTGARPDRMG
jgi:hypothetical protein